MPIDSPSSFVRSLEDSLERRAGERRDGGAVSRDNDLGGFRRLVLAVAGVQAIIVVDVMIMLIAAPMVGEDLGASGGELQLLFAAYAVAVAIGLVPSGLIGDMVGRDRMVQAGLMLFVAVSVLAAIAPNMGVLIVCRVLAGLAAATLTPHVLAVVQNAIPVERRARAFAVWGLAGAVATIAGQLGGGLLLRLDLFGLEWRTGFGVIAALALIALVVTWGIIPAARIARRYSFDVLGTGLLAVGLYSLIYPLAMGRSAGWPAWMFGLLIAAAVLLPAFALWELRLAEKGGEPLLDLRLLLVPSYQVGLVAGLLYYGCVSTLMFLFTIFSQIGLGMSPLTAGALFSVNALGFVAGSMVGSRRVTLDTALVGAVIGVAGLVVLAGEALALGADMSAAYFIPGLVLTGVSQGAVIPQLMRFSLSDVRPAQVSRAGAAISTAQQGAGAILVAMIGTVFFWVVDGDDGPDGYARSFAITLLCVAVLQTASLGVHLAAPSDRRCGCRPPQGRPPLEPAGGRGAPASRGRGRRRRRAVTWTLGTTARRGT